MTMISDWNLNLKENERIDDLLNIQNKYDEVNLLTKLTLVEEILKRLNSNADIKLILQKFILDWQNK